MDFMLLADRFGVSVAVMVFTGIGLWRILAWLGNKVVVPIADSHIALVEETKVATKTNSETLSKMTDILKIKAVTLDVIRRDVDQINTKLDNVLEKHEPPHLPAPASVQPQA